MTDEQNDPWNSDNFEATVDKRRQSIQNIDNIVKAMDAQFQVETHKIVQKHTQGEGEPDYSVLDATSENYQAEAAQELHKAVDEVYSINSEFHPLKGVINENKLDDKMFADKFIQGAYFEHVDDLKSSIGHANYVGNMEAAFRKNNNALNRKLANHAVSDIDPNKHGEAIANILVEKTGADENLFDKGNLIRNIASEVLSYINNRTNRKSIESGYRKSDAEIEAYRNAA